MSSVSDETTSLLVFRPKERSRNTGTENARTRNGNRADEETTLAAYVVVAVVDRCSENCFCAY